jgi:hypothetical protein
MPAAFNPISRIDPPQVSLNAATAIGPGSVIVFSGPQTTVSMQVTFTGAPTTLTVVMEGSLDGVNFTTLGTATNPTNNAIVTSTTTEALYARANMTVLTGGTSPTVTARIMP